MGPAPCLFCLSFWFFFTQNRPGLFCFSLFFSPEFARKRAHATRAIKMFSASTSLRSTRVANVASPARASNGKVGRRRTKPSRSLFFFRFFFLPVKFTAVRGGTKTTRHPINRLLVLASRANRAVSRALDGHIYTLVTEMGTSRFCSSQSGRENVSVSSRVSARSARADGKTSSLGLGVKTSTFLSHVCTFRLSILCSLKFRLQSPRFAWLKTKT